MFRRHGILMSWAAGLVGWVPAAAAEQRALSIAEPFGLAWGPDRVSYTLEFPKAP